MTSSEKRYERLEQALKRAHNQQENCSATPAGEVWRSRVMRSIRQIHPHDSRSDFFAIFGNFVWRMAPVATIFLIVLSVLVAGLDFIPEQELLAIFIPEPESLTITQTLGL